MSNTNHGICTSNYKIGVCALVSVHNTLNVSNKIFHLNFLPVWGAMGDALHCEKSPPRLAWFLCGQEKEESLESCPPLLDVDHLERKK